MATIKGEPMRIHELSRGELEAALKREIAWGYKQFMLRRAAEQRLKARAATKTRSAANKAVGEVGFD